MDKGKINVGILFGGKSAEHEISLRSAKNVIEALDLTKYHPILIRIDKSGKWLYNRETDLLLNQDNVNHMQLNAESDHVAILPQSAGLLSNLSDGDREIRIDVVFPILHGPFGEDGTIQGLLKLADVPFVGADVLGSAVGMDKDVMKRLLKEAGIPIAKYRTIRASEPVPAYDEISAVLGSPCFVKPANLGSSVGINRVDNEDQYQKAVAEAFTFDRKVIIEEYIDGREIELAVLGNERPKVSVPGEITFTHDFYSYEAKYKDDAGFKLDIPAILPTAVVSQLQVLAIKTFQTLECEGFARVDFFIKNESEILVNEINTIPGFTKISMYPKLWQASGVSYPDLIDQLLTLAIDRHQKLKQVRSSI